MGRFDEALLNLTEKLLLQVPFVFFDLGLTLLSLDDLAKLVVPGLALLLAEIVPYVHIRRVDDLLAEFSHLRVRHGADVLAQLRHEVVVLLVGKDWEVTAL